MTDFQNLVEQTGKPEGVKFFNRHNLFTRHDLDTVIKLINFQDEYNLDDEFEFVNQCYGLFDGFLYNDGELILNQLQKLDNCVEGIPLSHRIIISDGQDLIEKIKNYLS